MGPAWLERAIFGVGIETAGGRWEAVLVWQKRRGAVDEESLADWWENKVRKEARVAQGEAVERCRYGRGWYGGGSGFSGRRRRGD